MGLLRRHRRAPEPIPMTIDEIRATTIALSRLNSASDQMSVALDRVQHLVEQRRNALGENEEGQSGG